MLTINGKGQTVRFFSTARVEGKAYRIRIKVDSVKEQGSAVLEIWSEASSSWNELSSLPGLDMSTDCQLGYKRTTPDKHDFWNDVESLLSRASVISDNPLQFGEALAAALFD